MNCEFCEKETITKLLNIPICTECLAVILRILNNWINSLPVKGIGSLLRGGLAR